MRGAEQGLMCMRRHCQLQESAETLQESETLDWPTLLTCKCIDNLGTATCMHLLAGEWDMFNC